MTTFAINPVAFALLADLYRPAQRGRALTVMSLGSAAGMSATFALGGALLAMSGPAQNGWRWGMLWLAAPLVPVVLATLGMREPQRTDVLIRNATVRQAFAELWRYRATVVPLLAVVAVAEVALGAVLIWAAPALSRRFAAPLDRIDSIMAMALLVSGVLGPIAGGILADICERAGGPRRTMSALSGLAFLCAPAGLFAVMPGLTSAAALLITFITIVSAIVVMETTLFTIVIPNELRGLCMGVVVAVCVLIGTGLAPLPVSLVSSAIGGPAMIGGALSLICVTTSLAGAAICVFGRRNCSAKTV